MTKRKLTVHNVALELAQERLEVARYKHNIAYTNIGSDTAFTGTVDDYYPKAIEFVLKCRKAVWS